MAIDQKDTQAKEFLDRVDIVTMKKDIKRLREADTFKESAKITMAPITSQSAKTPETVSSLDASPRLEPKKDFSRKITIEPAQKSPGLPTSKVSGDTKNATEEEKQKIFSLESQRTQAEKEIQLSGEKEHSLDSEKNAIQQEREDWQTKLNTMREDGQAGSEEQKEELEKKRWPVENELEKIENRIKDIDAKHKEIEASKGQLNQKVTQIDNSLKEIYSGIEKRIQETKKTETVNQQPIAPKVEKSRSQSDRGSSMVSPSGQTTQTPQEPEKAYLKNIPAAAKEKLAQSFNSEEAQRRKFLEDIDKWASFNNKEEQK